MTTTEIKKALYKEKPNATLNYIRMGNAYYFTTLEDSKTVVNFCIPIEEMGDTDFFPVMDAKLLNRWITN